MSLECQLFIVRLDLTSGVDQAVAVDRRLRDRLARWLAEERITGYRVDTVREDGDYEEQDLDRELITGRTGGRLPVVVINVTYDLQRPDRPDLSETAEVVREFGLERLLVYP
jgi:hypothetical protein